MVKFLADVSNHSGIWRFQEDFVPKEDDCPLFMVCLMFHFRTLKMNFYCTFKL